MEENNGYFIAIKKSDRSSIVSTNIQAIADFLEVSRMTIYRQFKKSHLYVCKQYIISSNVPLIKGKQKGNFDNFTKNK